jgi:protein-tyrosine phosphatase
MKTLKNRINLKIQIPKAATNEEPQKINLNDSNQATKSSISKITDNIFISGYIIGKNIPYLKSNDFTHVINCCVGSSLCSSDDNTDEQSLKQLYERNNIKYLSIILRDDPEADIFYHFSKIIKFLEEDEEIKNKKILFHCIEGKSRAPAMVAGYLMWKNKYKFPEVIDLIKSKRNCVDINLGFNIQLNKWENYLITTKKKKKIFNVINPSQNIFVIIKD